MVDIIPASLPFEISILAGQVAPSSLKMYERDFRAYLVFAGSPELAVASSTLARWRAHLSNTTQHSPNTINRMLSAVKRLMDAAEEQGFVPKGTCEEFKRVRGVKVVAMKDRTKPHNRRRIDPEAMRSLVSLPDPLTLVGLRDTAMLHTLASSGLRVHELATLRKPQITSTGEGYQVWVRGKNDLDFRAAPFSKEAYQWVQDWLAARPVESDYVFTGFAGKGGNRAKTTPLSPVSLWRIVKDYAEEIGLDQIKPHDFRRFVGTQLAKVNPRVAQLALGHKRIETTVKHYDLSTLEIGVTDNLY